MINDKSTIVSSVVKELRQAILDGMLKGGDRIIQEEWADKLKVSRMPIREALTQLEAIGLVKVIPHKGAIVNSFTKEDIEEVYTMRMMLEGLVVEKALPYISEVDKRLLEETLIEMENLEINEETNELYIQLNNEYHKLLRQKSPWVRLMKTVDNLGISPVAPSLLHEYYQQTQREHRLIYEAVCRGSASEVRSAVEYHVLRTKNNLLEYMEMID
ncbi:GntR family transcriptional regulator [Sporosarcina pasteurii]|nr:GntR family transcriptional regulator [Sporosarcina pasteurii]